MRTYMTRSEKLARWLRASGGVIVFALLLLAIFVPLYLLLSRQDIQEMLNQPFDKLPAWAVFVGLYLVLWFTRRGGK